MSVTHIDDWRSRKPAMRPLPDIVAAIDEAHASCDFDKLEHQPIGEVYAELEALGMSQAVVRAQASRIALLGVHLRPKGDASAPLVPRHRILRKLVEVFQFNRIALVCGPAGSGKTTIFVRLLTSDARARKLFPRIVRLDEIAKLDPRQAPEFVDCQHAHSFLHRFPAAPIAAFLRRPVRRRRRVHRLRRERRGRVRQHLQPCSRRTVRYGRKKDGIVAVGGGRN